MQTISFAKKLITCSLAGLVIGACVLRQGVTFFRNWIPVRFFSLLEFLCIAVAIACALIWQARKTNHPGTLAFWQGLIRYGVAYDLASFGWEKICHLQLVMPLSRLDLPYREFTPAELFWTFYSHSYLLGCIIASFQVIGAMLLLFSRTRLVGVFVLLPVLTNILFMDIFYEIGISVVIHASIMLAGTLYFLFIEFDRLKAFFFGIRNHLPALSLSKFTKTAMRLSIIYIPLLLIASNGRFEQNPQLIGKYEVTQISIGPRVLQRTSCADSVLTVVYFDIRNGCVFEFNSTEKRWNGFYKLEHGHIEINWRSPAGKPAFTGTLYPGDGTGNLVLKGGLGNDSASILLRKQ